MNVLLIIVDCLRYDHVTEELMPHLYKWGKEHTWFNNYWSTSHCTDPAITHMLSGKHPDELGLYSMMYEHKDYSIPENVQMLSQLAKENGYATGFITNIGRWYKRGVDHFVDCRRWEGKQIFAEGVSQVLSLKEPWFLIVHTDDCHTNYTGGSYDAACRAVDGYIQQLLTVVPKDTYILVTSDHGEGLGDRGIQQHGFGLWDFLTHVPLLTNAPHDLECNFLCDPDFIYKLIKGTITGEPQEYEVPIYVFQAGDTPPNIRHRGVVREDGAQLIIERRGNDRKLYKIVGSSVVHDSDFELMAFWLSNHLSRYGIDLYENEPEEEVLERLRGLGYFN